MRLAKSSVREARGLTARSLVTGINSLAEGGDPAKTDCDVHCDVASRNSRITGIAALLREVSAAGFEDMVGDAKLRQFGDDRVAEIMDASKRPH